MKYLILLCSFSLLISCEKDENFFSQIDGSYNIIEHTLYKAGDTLDLIPPNLDSYRRNFSIFNYNSGDYCSSYLVIENGTTNVSIEYQFKLLNEGHIIDIKEYDGALRSYKITYLSSSKMRFDIETPTFRETMLLEK